jgi:hypothetical protein
LEPVRRKKPAIAAWFVLLLAGAAALAACLGSTPTTPPLTATRPPPSLTPTLVTPGATLTPIPTASPLPATATASPSPAATTTAAGCAQSSFGTMLLQAAGGASIAPGNVLIYANDELGVKGLALAGAPSDAVRETFARLPGWTRAFIRGTYESLRPIPQAAAVFGMADMYECFAYGPESAHQAGDEALAPEQWVPRAEALAEEVGKCLIYGPAVQDYEALARERGLPDPSALVARVAPHVDIWMIQLAKYQNWVDRGRDEAGNPYTLADFERWAAAWVRWIKAANPQARVWTQLGIGRYDPLARACLPPQPVGYLLDYRDALVRAGVDGISVMPPQPCMPCPPSPAPGFPCSTDPQDGEAYRQALATFQEAIETACRPGAGAAVATPSVSQPGAARTGCGASAMGASLMALDEFGDSTGPELAALAADGYRGLAATLTYDLAAEYFPVLDGWQRVQICNRLDCLHTRAERAATEGLAYEYLGYGPERLGGVPQAEQDDLPAGARAARQVADDWGKRLMLSYSTKQLHQEAEERGYGWQDAGQVVALLAPYADAWLIQAADEYNNPATNPRHPGPILSQRHFPPGPEWRAEVEKWVGWIRAANPEVEIWIQLALHRIPAGGSATAAGPRPANEPSADLLLDYREWLVNPRYGPPLVDGVFVSSVYSWPIDPALADAQMVDAFHLACGGPAAAAGTPAASPTPAVAATMPTPSSGGISLVEEGWTDGLEVSGITVLPGYYYRLYENDRYSCGAEGHHQFLVLDHGPDATVERHLFAKFLGGAAGFWYLDAEGQRLYYPQPNAVGLLNEALNRNWMFRTSVSQEFANGVTRRFRENQDFRILVPSYCSHDFYHGSGQCDEIDGFCRYGYPAANEALDYVEQNFTTGQVIVYGGSAGAAGFYVGQGRPEVAGIIMDSQALDLSAIAESCRAGHDAFGGAFPCFCPAGGPACMEVLAGRIGFQLSVDEPYRMVERGEVTTPLFLVWNYHDASRNAHYQYDNLHQAIKKHNPGGSSVACRVCLPHADPAIPDNCIEDDTYEPVGTCNLHVPTAYDNDDTAQLVDDVYRWALARVGAGP